MPSRKKRVARKKVALPARLKVKGAEHVKDFMLAITPSALMLDGKLPDSGPDRNALALKIRKLAVALAKQADYVESE